MVKLDIDKTNSITKKAWIENWQPISVERVMEIFTYPRVQKTMQLLQRFLPRDGVILEAGCGLGPYLIKLRQLGYSVIGIDYQEECIEKIKNYSSHQPVCVADVRNIPFKDNSFAAYLSFGVIEHFAEGPYAALAEAFRALSLDGILILTDPHKNIFIRIKAPLNWLKRKTLIRRIFNKPPRLYYYQRYFRTKELTRLIALSGFSIREVIPTGHSFSLVTFSNIFRKKGSYDGENRLAVRLGGFLERVLPWASADSVAIIARK